MTPAPADRPPRTPPRVRQAVRADLPDILRIRAAVHENRLVSRVIGADEVREAIEDTGRGWVSLAPGAGTPPGGLARPADGDRVAGFAIGNARSGNIWALFVDPAFEGQGHGRALHDEMVAWLFAQGLPRLHLSTDPGTRAQRFYTAAGWQPLGLQADGEMGFELRAGGGRA